MPILLLRLALRWGWWGSTLSRTGELGWSWYLILFMLETYRNSEKWTATKATNQKMKSIQKLLLPEVWRALRGLWLEELITVRCECPGGCGWSTPKCAGWGQINGKALDDKAWSCTNLNLPGSARRFVGDPAKERERFEMKCFRHFLDRLKKAKPELCNFLQPQLESWKLIV